MIIYLIIIIFICVIFYLSYKMTQSSDENTRKIGTKVEGISTIIYGIIVFGSFALVLLAVAYKLLSFLFG